MYEPSQPPIIRSGDLCFNDGAPDLIGGASTMFLIVTAFDSPDGHEVLMGQDCIGKQLGSLARRVPHRYLFTVLSSLEEEP